MYNVQTIVRTCMNNAPDYSTMTGIVNKYIDNVEPTFIVQLMVNIDS